MRKINKIIIHCSDSEWGDVDDIDQWHKERGWDGVGYNYVITNGRPKSGDYQEAWDGRIQEGRPVSKQGAHCKGENHDSIGICLIGKHHFTSNQLYRALPDLLISLMYTYNIPIDNIYSHHHFNKDKTCPNFSVISFKAFLQYIRLADY